MFSLILIIIIQDILAHLEAPIIRYGAPVFIVFTN